VASNLIRQWLTLNQFINLVGSGKIANYFYQYDILFDIFAIYPTCVLSTMIFYNNLPMSAFIGTDAAEQAFSLHVVQMIFNAVLG